VFGQRKCQVFLFSGPVHPSLDKFENRGFSLKLHPMFSIYTALEGVKNTTITLHFGLVFEENLVKKST